MHGAALSGLEFALESGHRALPACPLSSTLGGAHKDATRPHSTPQGQHTLFSFSFHLSEGAGRCQHHLRRATLHAETRQCLWPPAKATPAPSTDPPFHPTARQRLPKRAQCGHGPVGGQDMRGRRETHSTHLHGNQTHSLPEELGEKQGHFNKPQKRPHTAPGSYFWERTPRKQFNRGKKDACTKTFAAWAVTNRLESKELSAVKPRDPLGY